MGWQPELIVDQALARRLLAQFQELEILSLRPFAAGWDYAIWIVNDEWAFRFPRRAVAVPGIEREISILPELAPSLPLPVPVAEFVGVPTEEFPWPFFGSRLLPGRELSELHLSDETRQRIALELAAFLRRLHAIPPPSGLPVDANARADMTRRVPVARAQIAQVEALGLWRRPPHLDAVLEGAETLAPAPATTLVHGDLHFRQVLADPEGRVTGVIDWVDVCRSDPSIDLALYWNFVPVGARRRFLDAYGPVTDDQLLRARVVALSLSAALAHYGRVEGARAVAREALMGLDRAAES